MRVLCLPAERPAARPRPAMLLSPPSPVPPACGPAWGWSASWGRSHIPRSGSGQEGPGMRGPEQLDHPRRPGHICPAVCPRPAQDQAPAGRGQEPRPPFSLQGSLRANLERTGSSGTAQKDGNTCTSRHRPPGPRLPFHQTPRARQPAFSRPVPASHPSRPPSPW